MSSALSAVLVQYTPLPGGRTLESDKNSPMAKGISLCSAFLAACVLSGCSQPRALSAAPSDPDATLVTLRAHEFIRPGQPVSALIGVREPGWAGGEAEVIGADGATLGAATLQVLTLAPASDPGAWTGAWPQWTLTPVDGAVEPGSTVLALTPVVAEDSSSVSIGGAAIALRHVSSDLKRVADAPCALQPALIANEAADPLRWWRLDLLGAASAPHHETVHRLAEQVRNQWAAALARLRESDPARHDRLLASLTRTMQIDDGACYPAWRTDAARLGTLLDELSAADATALRLAQAADTWLADDADALAWIIDDGAGGRAARLGVANFTDAPVAASASAAGRVEMITLPASSVREIEIAAPIAGDAQIDVRIGRDRFILSAMTEPWRATPPGVRIGPLLPQWTLATWLGESPVVIDPVWATGALLQRADGDGERWELFVDGRAAAEPDSADKVTVIVGDAHAPIGTITVRATGEVEVRPSSWSSDIAVSIRREPGRWTALVTLPATWTSEDILLLGLERVDGRSVRSSWPRAVTPWQTVPPSAAIDLRAWDEAPSTR